MKTFKYEIIFICGNTNQEKTIIKEYTALNYLDAKQGIKSYCATNKTFKKVLDLRCLKFGTKSRNLI